MQVCSVVQRGRGVCIIGEPNLTKSRHEVESFFLCKDYNYYTVHKVGS